MKQLTEKEILELEELERTFQWWNDDIQYEHQLQGNDRAEYEAFTGAALDEDYQHEIWSHR